jgi:transcription elongation factor/antiterminator RfaH
MQKATNPLWYAVYTRPRHERKVNRHLSKDGYTTFLPEIERWSRRKDRRKKIVAPIFPGYLFVHAELDGEKRLRVLRTDGVVRILGNNGTPVAVPDNQIESIRTIVQSKTPVNPYRYLKRGRMVRVVTGPLEGVEGIFLSAKGSGKLVVSVELLRRSVSVTIDPGDIEPI